LSRGDGDIIQFKGGSSGFAVSGAVQHRLAVVAGGYLFSDAKSGTLEMFDSAGNLRTLTTAGSMTLTFAYDGTHLTKVTASDGRALMFSYAGDKITSVTAPDWTTINASYDAQDNLVGLNWPDGKTFGFVYGHPNLSWAMTGTVDEKGLPFTEYAYDAFGRATSTQLAGGAEHFSVTYSSPPVLTGSLRYDPNLDLWIRGWGWTAPAGTSVSLPGGALTALGAQVAGGIPVVVSRDQPAGSGCGAATSRQAYDTAVGNVLWREDFTGSRTCYSYDTSNRETARIEGLPADTECSTVNPTALPNGARKITTAWHPDWSMPTVVTEALKVTTLVYHGTETPSCTTAPNRADGKPAPVVCQRIEQALLAGVVDTSVPARVERFTYDSVGRVTSRTDANSNATTYAYYPSTSFVGDAFDPNIAGVALLLHADSPNGSAVVSDSSVSRHPVTKVGNAALSTAQYRFGGVSLAFDASGAGGYVSIPNSADFAFGSGDFTIEAFVYKTANNPNASRIWNPNGDFYDGVALGIDASGNFYAAASTTGNSWPYSLSPANLANNHWYHLAVVRSGGSLFAFVDGVRYVVTTALGSAVLYADSHDRVIGGQAGVNRSLNGYVDEFRITRGVARYTANFTPPTAPFADTGPTKDSVGHTAGDLQSVTNAANQATQYTSYDPAGRVRQMVDPKGITTDIKYTPRGWVDTVTVTPPGGTGRVTHYEYDSAGLLTGVNLPDGTALSYGYDPVHRLTSITDARGNSITYTLDNLSNRTVEEVRDASGTLKRTVSRVFDALNRVQQVTGSQQ
jgi:YD repeat-containing protein